jgi:heavy metal sensor kinase
MRHQFLNTIAFRLTLWFTGIFAICSGVVFVVFYFFASQTIQSQMDQELLDTASKFTAIISRNGLLGARELAVVEAQAAGEKTTFLRLVYPTGEVFASSHMAYWKGIGVNKQALGNLLHTRHDFFETIQIRDSGQKARILYSFVAKNAILQSGIAMDSYSNYLSAFKKVFMAVMGFIILFSALSGWLLVRKTLAGVTGITRTANNITGNNLEARVAGTGNKDELDHLATTFNLMLDRIETLVKGIREMSDNIAHDLKSPVTRIRGFAELALTQDDDLEEYRIMASSTIEESDRLLDMINTMLVISKADAGEMDLQLESMDLSEMIKGACELFSPLAEDKNIAFINSIEKNICVVADIRMLQRAFSNLLDNAIKYTPGNGKICIELSKETKTENGKVVIQVEDSGIGIPETDVDKIFKRFYRAESSRTTPGTGLGLSLARAIIRQHNGDITVSMPKGSGTVFRITLPYNNLVVI